MGKNLGKPAHTAINMDPIFFAFIFEHYTVYKALTVDSIINPIALILIYKNTIVSLYGAILL